MTRIKLIQTPEHDCPYLDDQESITQFLDPNIVPDNLLYSHFTQYGFRRSGDHIYRPACPKCSACESVRIIVNDMVHSKSMKRSLKSGNQFEYIQTDASDSDEHYTLYEQYINYRHSDGDMYPPSRKLYRSFLLSNWTNTQFLEIREQNELIACAVFDILDDGFSAIYSYFNPHMEKISLGKLLILKQIELAKLANLEYLYIGYQIDECRKMNYKTQYKPYEKFDGKKWNLNQA